MVIGGLQKMSLLDYPGHLAAIIFTQGCNFRCHFCYNPMLVWPLSVGKIKYKKDHALISEDDLFSFLKKRSGKLSAVVITGGEPTIQKGLPLFLSKIKNMGFLIKIDTNGTNPETITKLIDKKLIDYIAMDIKAPLEKYNKVTGVKLNLAKIKKSIKIVIKGGLPYEFRTTIVPGLLDEEDIKEIGKLIKGADRWFLQQAKLNTELVSRDFENKKTYKDSELKKMLKQAKNYVKNCKLR